MKNARIHEALCLLFPASDPRTAWKLEQGPHTNFEIAVTEWNLPDPQPTQAEIDAVYPRLTQIDRRIEILRELDAIDMQSVRPLRAKLAGTAAADDEARLTSLEAQAQTLRTELAGLPQ